MQEPVQVAKDTWLLPTPFAIPGMGVLYVNAMVITGEEPVLVDTGPPVMREDYLRTAFSLVDPVDVRWIFLSHDDRDHSGNLMQVLELCPNARLVTNFVGVGRMGEEWALPMPRIHFANNGDRFHAGDRELVAIRPPFFDSPLAVCGIPTRASTTAPTPSVRWCPSPVRAWPTCRPTPTARGSTGSTGPTTPGTC
jgi:hypothetical protein